MTFQHLRGRDAQPDIVFNGDEEARYLAENRSLIPFFSRMITDELAMRERREPSVRDVLYFQQRRRRAFLEARRVERDRAERQRRKEQPFVPFTWTPERRAGE